LAAAKIDCQNKAHRIAMHLLEKLCFAIRHKSPLRRADWLWNTVLFLVLPLPLILWWFG